MRRMRGHRGSRIVCASHGSRLYSTKLLHPNRQPWCCWTSSRLPLACWRRARMLVLGYHTHLVSGSSHKSLELARVLQRLMDVRSFQPRETGKCIKPRCGRWFFSPTSSLFSSSIDISSTKIISSDSSITARLQNLLIRSQLSHVLAKFRPRSQWREAL